MRNTDFNLNLMIIERDKKKDNLFRKSNKLLCKSTAEASNDDSKKL